MRAPSLRVIHKDCTPPPGEAEECNCPFSGFRSGESGARCQLVEDQLEWGNLDTLGRLWGVRVRNHGSLACAGRRIGIKSPRHVADRKTAPSPDSQ